jgi:beta-mannosidase
MDVLYGCIDDARIAEQMRLARDANLNLLRVWGGGIVARDLFYDLADRYGIMFWQEFPLCCTDHEGNPHFREVLQEEAQSMVRALRRHPSLALWCGGNELFMPHSGMGPQDRLVRMLGSVCYTLDPERVFLPSTPYPGAFHGPYTFDSFGQGGFGSSVDHVRFCNTAPDGAYNECGVAGPAHASLVKKYAPPEEWWPPKRGGTWEFHKAFGAWGDGNTWLLPELIEGYFGTIDRLEDLCRAGQFLQAIGLQYLLEEMRRKWPNVPGTMPWCFNTPWASFAGSFVVEYPDTPLPAYHALAAAYAPRNVSARLQSFVARPGQVATIEPFVLNDGGAPVGPGVVTAAIGPLGGPAWVERKLAAPAVQTMGRAALRQVSVDIPPDFRGVVGISVGWQHSGGEERNRSYLGVAPGDAPSACFRPLLALWDRDPAARLPGME